MPSAAAPLGGGGKVPKVLNNYQQRSLLVCTHVLTTWLGHLVRSCYLGVSFLVHALLVPALRLAASWLCYPFCGRAFFGHVAL